MQPDQIPAQEEAALLTDLAVCGFCGRPVRTELRRGARLAYRCGADGQRDHLLRNVAPVDGWVRLRVLEHLERSGIPKLPSSLAPPDLDALRAHAAALRAHLAHLAAASRAGTVDRSAAVGGGERVGGELGVVEIEMTRHVTHELPASLTGAGPLEIAWDRLGTGRQRAILHRLTERIALHPVPPGRRPGDPDVLRSTVAVAWVHP